MPHAETGCSRQTASVSSRRYRPVGIIARVFYRFTPPIGASDQLPARPCPGVAGYSESLRWHGVRLNQEESPMADKSGSLSTVTLSRTGADRRGRRRRRAVRRRSQRARGPRHPGRSPQPDADPALGLRQAGTLRRPRAVERLPPSAPTTRTVSASSTSRSPSTAPSPTRRSPGWPRAGNTTPTPPQLTIKTRSGITWSDGTPFSAEDVAYTINAVRDYGPEVRWGVERRAVRRGRGRRERDRRSSSSSRSRPRASCTS